MTDVILAVVQHPGAVAPILTAAARLAELAGRAHVNVLAIRMPPDADIVPGEEVLTRQHIERITARENVRVAALRAAFDHCPDSSGWEWSEVEGLVEPTIEAWGGRADTIVMPRPMPGEDRAAVHAALFRTDRPVLLVPPGWNGTLGRCAAIAWRDDQRAVKAVIPALHWLKGPQPVIVLAGVRPDEPVPPVPEILAEHGIPTALHALPVSTGVFGAILLSTARGLGADLLIAGAYSHSPLRELVLGGVTQHLLSHADIPILLRH